jgi:hypothetical protein
MAIAAIAGAALGTAFLCLWVRSSRVLDRLEIRGARSWTVYSEGGVVILYVEHFYRPYPFPQSSQDQWKREWVRESPSSSIRLSSGLRTSPYSYWRRRARFGFFCESRDSQYVRGVGYGCVRHVVAIPCWTPVALCMMPGLVYVRSRLRRRTVHRPGFSIVGPGAPASADGSGTAEGHGDGRRGRS